MLPQWIIEKKRDGSILSEKEINSFIDGYTKGDIPDYQMSALAMAIFFKGMTPEETANLTIAMMESGKVIDPMMIPGSKVDKHSTGGIGDKTSIPLAPLVAACGATVPMISGRGLGITGGTLDKLESIKNYRVGLSEPEFFDTLKQCGCSMIGQTAEIAPADKKLYALRDVTATVPSIPLIVSSIMSKKMAEGIDALVLDVKCGSGAFMKKIEDARRLAQALVDTGKAVGRKTVALITDMNQPLGHTVGNALEMQESIAILNGKGPADVRALTIELAEQMLEVAGIQCTDVVSKLDNGSAYAIFKKMIQCHKGNLDAGLAKASIITEFKSTVSGYIQKADAELIGRASLLLGAGRAKTSDQIDHATGISNLKKIGDKVKKNEPLCLVHANDKAKETEAIKLLESAFEIVDQHIEPSTLIIEKIN